MAKYKVVRMTLRELTPARLDEEDDRGWSLVASLGPWKHIFGIGLFQQPFITLIFRKGKSD